MAAGINDVWREVVVVTSSKLSPTWAARTTDFERVATIQVGDLPHGLRLSGDGSRIYVSLENDDKLAVIDTATNKVVGAVPIGQAPQAIAYIPNAVAQREALLSPRCPRYNVRCRPTSRHSFRRCERRLS